MTDKPASGKSGDAYRTISEVSTELDLPQHVLRFWETRFPQLRPLKRAGGRRFYRPADLALLRRIRGLLHDEGYTIKGVQRLLREGGARGPREPLGGPVEAAGGVGSDAPSDAPGDAAETEPDGPGDTASGVINLDLSLAAATGDSAPAERGNGPATSGAAAGDGGIPAQAQLKSGKRERDAAGGAEAGRAALLVIEECERRLRAALALAG